jgi:hypothetical protein
MKKLVFILLFLLVVSSSVLAQGSPTGGREVNLDSCIRYISSFLGKKPTTTQPLGGGINLNYLLNCLNYLSSLGRRPTGTPTTTPTGGREIDFNYIFACMQYFGGLLGRPTGTPTTTITIPEGRRVDINNCLNYLSSLGRRPTGTPTTTPTGGRELDFNYIFACMQYFGGLLGRPTGTPTTTITIPEGRQLNLDNCLRYFSEVLREVKFNIPTTTPVSPIGGGRNIDLTCMQNAVEKRENSLKTARETYFNKINQAYDERKTALSNAWTIQDLRERQNKINEAWNTFRKNINSAKEEYKKTYNQILKTFTEDRKNCNSGPTYEPTYLDLYF